MKKSFFLYFLVLSPLLFSQSSYQTKLVNLMNNPNSNLVHINYLSDRNLTIIDKNYSSNLDNIWATEPAKLSTGINKSEFTSLLLIRQLEELNELTPFYISHNPTLERYIRVFLKDRRESLSQIMDRATYYFPIFEEYLDKYDLPLEIKYLAIIESALKPTASSPSGAKGLWQFMYGTGKQFGLNVNSYVDDRFDVTKSTEAACKYLSYLFNTFNDWDLALAAYNSGPANVKKAIKRAGGVTNYWKIRQFLPQETQGYLPAFYATFYIFEYADMHNLKSSSSTLSYFEIDTIQIKKQLSFAKIQNIIPIENNLLKSLNPQYKKEIIPFSKNKKYVLTLPKELTSTFIENENSLYQTSDNKTSSESFSNHIKITEYNSYIVKASDNLIKIADKHQITLTELKTWNGLQTNYLITGQRLVITNKTQNDPTIIDDTKNSFSLPISPVLSPVKNESKKPSVL